MLTNAEVREHSQQSAAAITAGTKTMTYCVAMCLSDGLVFASDSRTNAGSGPLLQRLKTARFPSGWRTGHGAAVGGKPGHHAKRD